MADSGRMEGIKARHQLMPDKGALSPTCCTSCLVAWPCDTAVVLREMEIMEEAVTKVLEAVFSTTSAIEKRLEIDAN